MSLITLVVADDHTIFRQGLRSLIMTEPACTIVAECSRGDQALELIRRHRPTVAVLDISMPHQDGLSVVQELRQAGDTTPVVILTTHDDPLMLERARRCGANAYVNKEFAFEELLQALHRVADGTSLLGGADENGRVASSQVLSEREREVLRLVVRGMSNRLIAGVLGVSSKTVDNHRTNLMRKLGVHSTAELVRYAVKVGLE